MEDDYAPSGRSMDIELGGQEVITIDLENLDPNPEDVLDLLKDGGCKVWIWTKLAGEYWRRGYLDAAERIARSAVECFETNGSTSSLPPVYALLANIQIANSRQKPKMVLQQAQQDILTGEKPKEEYYKEAALLLNKGERASSASGEGVGGQLSFLTRGIHQLATQSLDDAFRSFEGVLSEKPTNVIALLGKARILYARRSYRESLRLFQQVLMYNPSCIPDPRIGIGLCYWALDNKTKATQAWQRSMEVNPSEWPSQLLIGLEAINSSKNTNYSEKDRAELLMQGTELVQRAFKANQKSAAAANALCEILLRKGQTNKALKLAERTVQFADTLTILNEGYIRAARVLHAAGSLGQASRYYNLATEGQKKPLLGSIGLAQMQMQNDEMAAAIHTLDTLFKENQPRLPEALVMLASLRAHPRPGVSSSDYAQERAKARELFDKVFKEFGQEISNANGQPNGQTPNKLPHSIANDVEMHVEIARLWQRENLERTSVALQEALRISEGNGEVDPRLLNNLGALQHMDNRLDDAQAMYERALTIASSSKLDAQESISTALLYNLARIYEDQGQESLAKDAYDKLLSRHPEYVDAKIRTAQMLANISRHNDAHDIIKQCLASQDKNLNLRAFYTYFLIQSNLPKVAKEFVFSTLKDHDKHDVYSLCAAGWIQYHQARESRDTTPAGIQDRKRGFQRAAEFYEKALHLDKYCAFAAQGLAIITAEDALGTLGGSLGTSGAADEAMKRNSNANDAIETFAKVREAIDDGSVYFNMGHCHYARDDFTKAIECYQMAANRYGSAPNVNVLLCLCRTWYSKAMKDQSFPSMCTALRHAQMALHVQPNDKAIMYNIAMIQQKSAEMLFSLPPNKRSLEDLQRVIEMAANAQRIFGSLAADPAPMVPYNRDIADQRRKYGDNMLKKGDEHLAAQRAYDEEHKAKNEAARRKRQEDKERLEEEERMKAEAKRLEDEKLAEERRLAREKAMEWSRDIKMESDEEREKRPKKQRKPKVDVGSGDEGAGGEPKKKRRGKLKKATPEQDDAEEEALFSGEDDAEAPVKKRVAKKRVVRDDDDEEAAAPKRKQSKFKSREVLSDTDDEMS